MSFSSDIKEEISMVNNYKNKKLLEAELLGYILTGNSIASDKYIEFVTENEFNIERFYKILFNLNIDYDPEIKGKVFVAKMNKDAALDEVLKVQFEDDEEIKKSIVKGAFLGAGTVIDPNKQYHLEIVFLDKSNALYISNLCAMFGISIKILEDKKYILYIKDGEEISKFLALIGATKGVLSFEDVRVTREIKNNVNRKVNCETANLNKVVNASVNQINDINFIKKMKKFDELPEYLKEIARVRLEFPDMPLKDLGQQLDKPLGKSGVNHRLQKIHEIAEELRK